MNTGNKMLTLIFYWYVPKCGWHKIYDLHLKNLSLYSKIFDKKRFIISHDNDTDDSAIYETIKKIRKIVPDASFEFYDNDTNLRESKYFYNEVALKLDKFFENEIVFFAHNKGVASTYVSEENLRYWINILYYCNLNNASVIKNCFSEENVLCCGTYCKTKWNPWWFYPLKNKWHYSGSYFWFHPSKLKKYIDENKLEIPKNDRYFTEGFCGNIIVDDDKYRKILFGETPPSEKPKDYFNRVFNNEEKKVFLEIYE